MGAGMGGGVGGGDMAENKIKSLPLGGLDSESEKETINKISK